MFRATMCPSSGGDDCVVLSPRVGIVQWLQEGCQNLLAASVSIEEFVAYTIFYDVSAIYSIMLELRILYFNHYYFSTLNTIDSTLLVL